MSGGERPALRDCFYDSDKRVWSVEGFWSHPQHRAYHKAWSGEYVIAQEYGNFTNEIRLVKLEDWAGAYTLAWEQMKVCEFCGFTRMAPCKTRQVCPNLTDYRLEDDTALAGEPSWPASPSLYGWEHLLRRPTRPSFFQPPFGCALTRRSGVLSDGQGHFQSRL